MTTSKNKRTEAVAKALAAAKVNTARVAKRMAAAKVAEASHDKALKERSDRVRERLTALDRNAAVDLTKRLNWRRKGE